MDIINKREKKEEDMEKDEMERMEALEKSATLREGLLNDDAAMENMDAKSQKSEE